MQRRRLRVSHLLRSELSLLLQRKVKDPRLVGLISVTEVELTPDLREAKVFVSVLGSQEECDKVMESLQGARGFFQHELGDRLDLRRVPSLTFYPDHSLERGAHILQIMDQLATPPSEESPEVEHPRHPEPG